MARGGLAISATSGWFVRARLVLGKAHPPIPRKTWMMRSELELKDRTGQDRGNPSFRILSETSGPGILEPYSNLLGP